MTPEPPASSDGSSLPQRHRPALSNHAKDTTERDLWDFDDDMEMSDEAVESEDLKVPRAFTGDIPVQRGSLLGKPVSPEPIAAFKAGGGEESIRMDITKRPLKKDDSGASRKSLQYESEFADLEHWQDARKMPQIEDLPAEVPLETVAPVAEVKVEEVKVAEPAPVVEAVTPATDEGDDEFSPVKRENAVPLSMRPHLGLSKLEWIGLIVLLVLLAGGGATIFLGSLNRLPVESANAESADFPIKGDRVTITSAKSYWRAPIVDGADADTFRRGTELLPVLELGASGGPASVRIFFRDEEGGMIGDAMTRRIDSEGVLRIPATAGFEISGMYAAYRTGESEPWTIEVWEIISGDATDGKPKKLFEMNVSTDRR